MFFFREGLPFYFWFYPPILDYDVSLHDLVKLFVVFSRAQEHQKRSPDDQNMFVFVLGVPAAWPA